MTTTPARSNSRRGLAIASIIVGAVATLMIIAFWIIGGATGGQGLSDASIAAVVFYYASLPVGVVAVLLGIAAVIVARLRVYGVLGVVLGLVPIVAVVATFSQGG
ncbi:hypothetical protein [Pseudactinotalea sp.]|uniref:hypothetical protein n=1 Tax=Pseudactinotalea sp. TaxID=1926260 RepID=UPI003B3BB155